MKKGREWLEEELEAQALIVDVDDKGMVLTIHRDSIIQLAKESNLEPTLKFPVLLVDYYEELEYHEQSEFLDTAHVLKSVYSGSFVNEIEEVAKWIKEHPEQYISFVDAVNNQIDYVSVDERKYFAVYDSQISGFKAGMAYDSYDEAIEGILDRIYSIHTDFYESDGYDSWEEFKTEEKWTDDDIIHFQGYEVKEVSFRYYKTVLNSED